MYTCIFAKNVTSHVTNLVSIICRLLNFAKEILCFGFFLAGKSRSDYFVCQITAKDSRMQTTFRQLNQMLPQWCSYLGKYAGKILSSSHHSFPARIRLFFFFPLLSLSPYRHLETGLSFAPHLTKPPPQTWLLASKNPLSVNKCAAFIPHFCFAGLAWMGIAKDSKRTPSSRAPTRTVSHCQHPTVWLCQSTLSSSDGNTRNLPALSRQSTGLAIPVKG